MAPMRSDNTISDVAPILDYLVDVADTEIDMAQLFSCPAMSHLELVCWHQLLLWIGRAGLHQHKLQILIYHRARFKKRECLHSSPRA
jgi:hypothetical protein